MEDNRLAEVAEVCLHYRARVVTDQYLAQAIVARLRAVGLHVTVLQMAAASKTAAYGEVRARLNAGSLELYNQQDLLGELRRLRTHYSAGSASVVNPRVGGSHGDLAQALALAVYSHRFSSDPSQYGDIGFLKSDLSDLYGEARPMSYDEIF